MVFHNFYFLFNLFLFIYISSQFNPMFFKKKTLFMLIFYSLNLDLCLHLAINSHLLLNNFPGSG